MLTAPPADALLTAWEQARSRTPAEGALALLAVARPDLDAPARGALTVGDRNVALLELRAAVLGQALHARADCPRCGEALELEVATDALRAVGEPEVGEPFELEHAGWRLRCRLLRAEDLAALARGTAGGAGTAGAGDTAAVLARARSWLAGRCVLDATPPDGAVEWPPPSEQTEGLPDDVVAALAFELARRDPHAELLLALTCPSCDHDWQAELDVAAFLADELHGWARRLLHQVHLLAAAYGWSETDILRLSPSRRRAYLDFVAEAPEAAGGGP